MNNSNNNEKILILDFGSQVTQLIARRVRESGVYSEIFPYTKWEEGLKKIKPNRGHMFVKEILDAKKGCVITQNIDGLHHRSGIQEKKIIEVHGNATKAKCLDCGISLDLEPFHKAIHDDQVTPDCPKCYGLVKVATISFGQPMNMNDFERSKDKIIKSDILIVLGSSLQVQPVASLPGFAVQNGKKLIIINKDPTSFDQYA